MSTVLVADTHQAFFTLHITDAVLLQLWKAPPVFQGQTEPIPQLFPTMRWVLLRRNSRLLPKGCASFSGKYVSSVFPEVSVIFSDAHALIGGAIQTPMFFFCACRLLLHRYEQHLRGAAGRVLHTASNSFLSTQMPLKPR